MADNKKINNLAILGGAFDPPHNIHLEIAAQAIKEIGYDKIIFLPSSNPPHKNLNTSSEDRLNMLQLALDNHPEYEISLFELNRDRIGYTVETLPELKALYGDFDFIIGGDSMTDMRKWYRPEKIIEDNNIVVAVRDGQDSAVRAAIESFGDIAKRNVRVLNYMPKSLSSTDIRLLAQLGEDIGGLVPQAVRDYIKDNDLYNEFKLLRDRLNDSLSEERYRHSISVVKRAMTLNKQYGLSYEKVFISALLHDCAKSKSIDCSRYPIPSDSLNSPVAHAFAGAYVAREYGIDDNEILNAIYYHTTGRAGMTPLEKLIYVADMTEENRTFDGVEKLRRLSENSIDKALFEGLKQTRMFLIENGKEIYYLTDSAYEYYSEINDTKERNT